MSRTDAPQPSPWWSPHRHQDRRPRLLARARIKQAIRAWLEGQGFIEVDPACLQVSPGNETHLHAFETELVGTDLARAPRYLHTSPELAMKKLLAAGEQRIFAFAPVFRNRERGALHAPEFTMLEWYRAREGAGDARGLLEAIRDDTEAIIRLAASVAGEPLLRYRDRVGDARGPFDRCTVIEAFALHLGLTPARAAELIERPCRKALAEVARARGHAIAPDETWSGIFSRLVADIEPRLGLGRPLLLSGYPASEAALARLDPANPALALRFEAYACGVELANGFAELNDPIEQRARLELQMAEKERIYGERYPIDEDFLAALAHMPDAAGCALGLDRLVMLATGASHIDEVQWTRVA